MQASAAGADIGSKCRHWQQVQALAGLAAGAGIGRIGSIACRHWQQVQDVWQQVQALAGLAAGAGIGRIGSMACRHWQQVQALAAGAGRLAAGAGIAAQSWREAWGEQGRWREG